MIEMIEKNSDYIQEAKDLQTGVLSEKPNFELIQEIASKQVQEVEDAIIEVMGLRDLDNAYGVHLEKLGEFYDVKRNGEADAAYRQRIRTAVIEKQGIGSIENLISSVRVALPDANYVKFKKSYPKTLEIEIDVDDQSTVTNQEVIKKSVESAQQLGDEITIKIASKGVGFRMAPDPNVPSTGRGFGQGILAEGIK